jgi:hypothetical protein
MRVRHDCPGRVAELTDTCILPTIPTWMSSLCRQARKVSCLCSTGTESLTRILQPLGLVVLRFRTPQSLTASLVKGVIIFAARQAQLSVTAEMIMDG